MARSVYGQLNQANIGQGIDTLLREIFEGDKEKYAIESSVMDTLSSTASDEASFQKLDKVLKEYWKRNDMHGPAFEAKEIKQRADYSHRKDEYYRYKEAHSDVLGMISSDYKISGTDKDGGIQNIDTVDVASWNHVQLTKELGKVNRIRESFSLGKNGYHYNPKGNNTSLSLARDIDTYYKSLTAALEIAVETGSIPDDDVLLRHIVSGRADKVKEHSDEQQQKASERYKAHDRDLDTLEDLHDKIISYKNQDPADFAAGMAGYLASSTKNKSPEESKLIGDILGNIMGTEGWNMDYNVYAQNVGVAITDKIALRDQANKRHKQYTGKLYEEVDDSLQKKMEEFASQGSSYETQEEVERLEREKQLKEEAAAKTKAEADSLKAREQLPDTTTTVAESTAVKQPVVKTTPGVAPSDTTGLKIFNEDTGKWEWVEKKTGTIKERREQKVAERKRKQVEVEKYNKESLLRIMEKEGVTQAPLDMYLDTIINDVTYEQSEIPKDYREKQAIENEIGKSIKINDTSLDTLFSELNPSGVSRQDFGKSIIKTWNKLGHDMKFQYGSFANFIEAILTDFRTVEVGRDLEIKGVVR
jgi:hypothetical protein